MVSAPDAVATAQAGGEAAGKACGIAQRRNRGIVGREEGVDDDAVGGGEAGLARDLLVRHHPDPDEDEVGREFAAVGEHDGLDPAGLAGEGSHPGAEREPHARRRVGLGEEGGGSCRDRARHRPFRGFDHADADAARDTDAREFEPARSAWSRSASARERSWCTPASPAPGTGRGRLRDPVARTRWS